MFVRWCLRTKPWREPTAALTGAGAKYRRTNQHPRLFHSTRETVRSSSAFNFRVDKGLGEMGVRCHQSPSVNSHNFTFSVASVSPTPPWSAASFEVNSEPHTGASPSARLFAGLINHHQYIAGFLDLRIYNLKHNYIQRYFSRLHFCKFEYMIQNTHIKSA
jgi:hypothetical protein